MREADIQVRFIGPSRSGRAYESPQEFATIAEAADLLCENGFRKLSGDPGPSTFAYGPDGITAHRGLSMPTNKWVAILDAVRNNGRETEFWADFYASDAGRPAPDTEENAK